MMHKARQDECSAFLFPKAAAVTPPQDPSRQTTTVRLREHTQDTLDSGYKEEAVIRAWYGNPQREWVSAPRVGIDVNAKGNTLLMLGNNISAANRSTGNPFDNAVVTVDEVRRRETMPAGFPRSKLPGGGRGEAALGGRHVYAVVCGRDREKEPPFNFTPADDALESRRTLL